MSTQPLRKSSEYAALAEENAQKSLDALAPGKGIHHYVAYGNIANMYATLAQAAATAEAAQLNSDIGPALKSVAFEVRSGLDAIQQAVKG